MSGGTGITRESAATTAPYWQRTLTANGGPCNASALPCSNPSDARRYLLPATMVSLVNSLAPGEWFTLQSFVLVKGTSPAYSTSRIRWDCSSPDPRRHWTNDWERYCYADWKAVVRAIAARADVTVTDPLTVGAAFGRTVPGGWPVGSGSAGGNRVGGGSVEVGPATDAHRSLRKPLLVPR